MRNNYQSVGNKRILEDCKTAMVCPVHKKGDRKDCNNNQRIALSNVAYKIFIYRYS